jgi:hypothetical protein
MYGPPLNKLGSWCVKALEWYWCPLASYEISKHTLCHILNNSFSKTQRLVESVFGSRDPMISLKIPINMQNFNIYFLYF